MNYLNLNAKIFHIDDGEGYWILANNEEEARDFYENSGECIDDDIKKEILKDSDENLRNSYNIHEICCDTKSEINISEDIELLNIINKYKNRNSYSNKLNIVLYAKYIILESELRNEEFKIPSIIASTIY